MLVVQDNFQGIPNPQEKYKKKKEACFHGCKKFSRNRKILQGMVCERKGWDEW
jgi:hypothetical protein